MKDIEMQGKQNTAEAAIISGDYDPAEVAEVKAAIRCDVEDDSREFSSFDAFFDWYDVLIGYDQMDEETSIEGDKEILKVAYAELVAEGFFTENTVTVKE